MWKWKFDILVYGLGHPVLYLTAIGLGVGTLVDHHTGARGIAGVSYLVFLAPALLATATMQGAQDEVTFPVLSGFIWAKLFFGMRATALTSRQIANGVLLASIARTVFTAMCYWLVLFGFGAVTLASAITLIPASIFGAVSFSTFVLWIASTVVHDDGFFALFGRLVITPMFLFSGTFYPLSTLPITVRWIGWISPLWHSTELGRALSFGAGISAPGFWVHVTFLAAVAGTGLMLAYRQFERRLSA